MIEDEDFKYHYWAPWDEQEIDWENFPLDEDAVYQDLKTFLCREVGLNSGFSFQGFYTKGYFLDWETKKWMDIILDESAPDLVEEYAEIEVNNKQEGMLFLLNEVLPSVEQEIREVIQDHFADEPFLFESYSK